MTAESDNDHGLSQSVRQHPDPIARRVVHRHPQTQTFRMERIVSQGHASPEGFWYDQDQNEWVMVLELLRWNEVFADLIDYLKSREWKQAVSDIAGESEGGDERRQRLLDLRLAVVVYPAVRKANKTK